MNCAHGCAAVPRRVFLWLAIDPCAKILPVLHLGPRTQHVAHLLIHSLQQILAAFLPPALYERRVTSLLLCADGPFGQWREVGRRRHNVRRWQVAAGLIYGQVKKWYRRRKPMYVMRLGALAVLAVALQEMGFGGAAEHGFHRAGESDGSTWNSSAVSSHLGYFSAVPIPVRIPGLVARLL